MVFPCMWEWSICTQHPEREPSTPTEHTHSMRRSGLEINRLASFSGTLYHPWQRDSDVCVPYWTATPGLRLWFQPGFILVQVKGVFSVIIYSPCCHSFLLRNTKQRCILRYFNKKNPNAGKSMATATIWISTFFKLSSFGYREEHYTDLNDLRGIDGVRRIIRGWKIYYTRVCLLFHKITLIKIWVCHFSSIHRRLRVSLRKKHHVCPNDLLLI